MISVAKYESSLDVRIRKSKFDLRTIELKSKDKIDFNSHSLSFWALLKSVYSNIFSARPGKTEMMT